MLLLFFGPSCSGKSSTADLIAQQIGADIWTGKDYLRLAKNEPESWDAFFELLRKAANDNHCNEKSIIYILTDSPDSIANLSSLSHVIRIRFTANLETLKQRFAPRMGGRIPPPVVTMLENVKNRTDCSPCDLCIDTTNRTPHEIAQEIIEMISVQAIKL